VIGGSKRRVPVKGAQPAPADQGGQFQIEQMPENAETRLPHEVKLGFKRRLGAGSLSESLIFFVTCRFAWSICHLANNVGQRSSVDYQS
jgi:hypothetical protein